MISARDPLRYARLAATLVALVVLTTACGGVHLYSKANHELAQQAEAAFKEAELAKGLETERQRLAEMSARDVELARRHTLALRDAELVAIIGGDTQESSWQRLRELTELRLAELNGPSPDTPASINDLLASEANLDSAARRYRLARPGPDDPTPACPWSPRAPTFSRPELKKAFEGYRQAVRAFDPERVEETRRACQAYEALNPSPSDPPLACGFSRTPLERLFYLYRQECERYLTLRDRPTGRIGTDAEEIAKIEDATRQLRTRLAELRRVYEEQVKRVEAAEAAEWSKEVAALRDTLKAFASAASATAQVLAKTGLADLASAGLIDKLELERARIDAAVEALVSGKAGAGATDPKAKRSLAIAAELGLVARAVTRPQVSHLILERERLRLDVELLRRLVAAAEERLRLRRRHLDALVLESSILSETLRSLNNARDGGCIQQSLFRDFERAQASADLAVQRCAELIGRALARYGNSYSAARVTQEELDYRILGNRHGVALDRSELALGQWENLVGTPLKQLVALYAAGLTPDEIARFLNAFATAAGLTFIGVGVQ